MAAYTATAWLTDQKFDWGDFAISGGVGCVSGVAGFGLAKAFTAIWGVSKSKVIMIS